MSESSPPRRPEDSGGSTQFDVQVECPGCGATFAAPRIRRGATETCPVCRQVVRVPGGASYSEATAGAAGETTISGEPAAPAASGRCIVCTQDDAKFDLTQIGPIISEATGQSLADVTSRIAGCRGILAEDVPAAAAKEIVGRLRGKALAGFVLGQEDIPSVERQLPLMRVHGLDEQALYVQSDVEGTIRTIPWQSIGGGFCTKRHVETGGPTELKVDTVEVATRGGMLREHVYKALPREPEPPIDCTLVIRGKSAGLYILRFSEKQVRYAYLEQRGETRRNFSTFLSDVIRHCPHAFFPSSTRAVASGNRMRVAVLKHDRDYDNYLKWALCCLAR